ncbi:hypothetical protein IPG41_06985 [Candidatus Peregrinibacteria bacterium]|nr:MAG: hypothetical protein IPG41_06985 [Candidatus Peregrinibacteria bacterium]
MQFIKEGTILIEYNEGFIDRLPDFHEVTAIEQLIDGLEWINQEFLEDAARYTDADEALQDNAFFVRNTTRTLAYANQVGLLEGLIKKSYMQLVTRLRFYVDPDIAEDENRLDLQRIGQQRTRDFRDKVAAHLAYVDPIKDGHKWKTPDNLSTQITSLMALLNPGCTGNDPKMFCLAASAVVVGGELPSNSIPSLNIYVTHNFLRNHYEKWGRMFDDLLKEAKKKLPIENTKFKVYLPN